MATVRINRLGTVGPDDKNGPVLTVVTESWGLYGPETVKWTRRALLYAFPALLVGGTGGTAWYMSPGETTRPAVVQQVQPAPVQQVPAAQTPVVTAPVPQAPAPVTQPMVIQPLVIQPVVIQPPAPNVVAIPSPAVSRTDVSPASPRPKSEAELANERLKERLRRQHGIQ